MGKLNIVSIAGRPLDEQQQQLADVKGFHGVCEAAGHQLNTGQESLWSGQNFQQIDPQKTVFEGNKNNRDGIFYLFNKDPEHDFFCQGIFNTNSGTLRIGTGKLSELQDEKPASEANLETTQEKKWAFDAQGFPLREDCNTAEHFLSEQEYAQTKCAQEDQVLDQAFVSAYETQEAEQKSYLAHLMVSECGAYYQSQTQKIWGRTKEFPLDLMQVERDLADTTGFRAQIKDEAANFLCEAHVDLLTGKFDVSAQALQAEESADNRFGVLSAEQESALFLGGLEEKISPYQLCLDAQTLGLAEAVGDCEKYNTQASHWNEFWDKHPVLGITLGLIAGPSLFAYGARRFMAAPVARILGKEAAAAHLSRPFLHHWRSGTGNSLTHRMYQALRNPNHRMHGLMQKLLYLGEPLARALARVSGLAYTSTIVYDGLASYFVGPEHWARKFGSPTVAGLSTGLLAAVEYRAITTASTEAATRGVASRMGESALGRTVLRLSNRLLLARLADYTFSLFEDDYELYVNHEVTKQVYQEDGVEDFNWSHLSPWLKPGELEAKVKSLRAMTHWATPEILEAAVAWDHPEKVKAQYKKDQWNALEIRKALRDSLPYMVVNENHENPEDLDFLRTEAPEELKGEELVLFKAAQYFSAEQIHEFFKQHRKSYDKTFKEFDHQLAQVFKKSLRNSFHKGAQFLYLVGQNEETDWYRSVFEEDGRLQRGKSEALIRQLYGSMDNYRARVKQAQAELTMKASQLG